MHIYNWYHSITTGILYVHEYRLHESRLIPLLLAFFCSLLLPFVPPLLTWNPPCCDRIRPPRTQVARKLTSHFPPLAHIPLIPKFRPPGVSQPQIYVHSLGRHCEPGSQDRAQLGRGCQSSI
jgi:hypothetical protein